MPRFLNLFNFKSGNLVQFRNFYTIPERYRNAFFLANASLFDYTNWYVHRAYESCFGNVVMNIRATYPDISEEKAKLKASNVIDLLEPCNGVIDVNIPVKKGDGSYEVVRGYRAIHALNLYDTPSLGGMRICSDLSKDHVRAFSVLSTYKHACFGIEMAGSHGGLKVCGYDYSSDDMEKIVVSYGKELAKRGFLGTYFRVKANTKNPSVQRHRLNYLSVGHRIDVLEPDLYCTSREMDWIANEFSKPPEVVGMACAVGKSAEKGGIEMYDKAFAIGVMYALNLFLGNNQILNQIGWNGDLKGKKYIIQGLGKIGSQLAVMLEDAGAVCVAIKEHDCFIHMEDGVPIKDLLQYKEETGSILEFNKYAKPATTEQIFTEHCDILVLSATHRSLQCHVAERVKARIVIEAAYSSMTPSAYKVLVARNRLVLPDIFVGAGASIASYLEYVKNTNDFPLKSLVSRVLNLALTSEAEKPALTDAEYLRKAIEEMMQKAYEHILARQKEYNLGLDIRTAAYTAAITKIFSRICEHKLF